MPKLDSKPQPRRSVAALWLALAALGAGCQSPPNGLLRQQAADALMLGNAQRAQQRLELAVEQDPGDWKAAMMLGQIRLTQDRALDAQLLLERAQALRPEHPETPEILDGVAESLYRQDRYESLHNFLATVASDRGTTLDYLRQARYLTLMQDRDGARVALKKAARFAAPDDATPYLAAADYYESIGDVPNAILALRRAHAIKPTSRRVSQRLRDHGIVPGPTAALPPEHIMEGRGP